MLPRSFIPRTPRTRLWGRLLAAGILWLLIAQASPPAQAPKPIPVEALKAPGLPNLFRIGPRLYSGAAPEGNAGFEALQQLGVRTLITVDGARPDVASARRYGLRYLHLPVGYDGIPTDTQAQLVKATRSQPGPFYVHCHHGQHRGPTAAAVICLAEGLWNSAQAEQWLQIAGTATHYTGLFESVRRFQAPTADALHRLPDNFPETAPVPAFVDTMVQIDQRIDHLKAIRQANYHSPAAHPDLQPAHELTLLIEQYRESRRLPEAVRRGTLFVAALESAEAEVREAQIQWARYTAHPELNVPRELDEAFDTVTRRCQTCHRAHRDTPTKPKK